MTYTIAVSNEKGGVAKTTTTLSLGAALAELNHRVLLIDLDPQANLSLALGLETGEAEITSANVLIENTPIKSAIRKTDVSNLELIPSNSRIESAEQYLPMRSNYLSILRQTILAGMLNYDYILFDCRRAWSDHTQRAVCLRPAHHPNTGRIFFCVCAEEHDGFDPPCPAGEQPESCVSHSRHITGSPKPNSPQHFRATANHVRSGCFHQRHRDRYKTQGKPHCRDADHPIPSHKPRFTTISRSCSGVNRICQRRNQPPNGLTSYSRI